MQGKRQGWVQLVAQAGLHSSITQHRSGQQHNMCMWSRQVELLFGGGGGRAAGEEKKRANAPPLTLLQP